MTATAGMDVPLGGAAPCRPSPSFRFAVSVIRFRDEGDDVSQFTLSSEPTYGVAVVFAHRFC